MLVKLRHSLLLNIERVRPKLKKNQQGKKKSSEGE